MSSASFALIFLSLGATALGLPCCLGWINCLAMPLSFACFVVGLVGLASDRDASGASRGVSVHLTAVVVGVLCGMVAFGRGLLGLFFV